VQNSQGVEHPIKRVIVAEMKNTNGITNNFLSIVFVLFMISITTESKTAKIITYIGTNTS
jgi:hypothetical protein